MNQLVLKDISWTEVEGLIAQRDSFKIIGAKDSIMDTIEELEHMIEDRGLSCRVYTKGRLAAAGASVFGGVTGVLGLASAIGIAAHNIATYNPDYELAKDIINNSITVSYMKA